MKSRKEFWAQSWQTGPKELALSVKRPYCKGFHLQPDVLKNINQQVFKILYNAMDDQAQKTVGTSEDHEKIIDWLGNTKVFFIDVTNQLDTYIELEKIILA